MTQNINAQSNRHEPKFKGVWIPKEIWNSTELTWLQKCLLAEIDSLDDDSGCYASNEYLAEKFQTSSESIKVIICRLRKTGWIKDVSSAKNGQDERRITVVHRKPQLTAALTTVNGSVNHGLRWEGVPYISEKKERKHDEEEIKTASPSFSFHEYFIAEWVEAYKDRFGIQYKFEGGRDGKAVKALSKMGRPPAELLDLARRAWEIKDTFLSTHCVTIHGFYNQLNQVQARLAKENQSRFNIPNL